MDASGIRLQKYLAQAGVASRRAAEEIILQGRVAVNGNVVTELGTRVRPGQDVVTLDGRHVGAREDLVYFALNKPRGVVSTARDPEGRPTVLDLVRTQQRIYPVGRLDADSEGLLLLTNDGELAQAVTHPSHEWEKEYRVMVTGTPSRRTLALLSGGMDLDGQRTAPAWISDEGGNGETTWLRVVLHEGRNRQIRRMCEALGHPVRYLQRVRIGPVRLGNLGVGQYRRLNATELNALLGKRG
ncbi:MAG: pseudouridine synthase [Chloroflexota bacterium]